jgi:hypothetical protein
MKVSLILAIKGGWQRLISLFNPSPNKDTMIWKCIVVDQNEDDRLETLLKNRNLPFPIVDDEIFGIAPATIGARIV